MLEKVRSQYLKTIIFVEIQKPFKWKKDLWHSEFHAPVLINIGGKAHGKFYKNLVKALREPTIGNLTSAMTIFMPSFSLLSLCFYIHGSLDILNVLCISSKTTYYQRKTAILLVPRTEHHFSSFRCGFLNIFSLQNLLRSLSRLLFLLRWNKYGAKMSEKPHSIRRLR